MSPSQLTEREAESLSMCGGSLESVIFLRVFKGLKQVIKRGWKFGSGEPCGSTTFLVLNLK